MMGGVEMTMGSLEIRKNLRINNQDVRSVRVTAKIMK